MQTISIIGFSHGDNLEKDLYLKMVMKACDVILEIPGIKPEYVMLVSGGSSWSDHVAVTLYSSGKFKGCKLFLPCKLIKIEGKYQFEDNVISHGKLIQEGFLIVIMISLN